MSLESVFKLSLIMNMVDHLSGPTAGIASRVGADVARLDALSQTLGATLKTGVAMQEMGAQITGAVLAPVEATFETRKALGELSSLGVENLDALENAARSFSDQWSGVTKADFITAAYDIKSGIASLSDEGVAEFTALAALTAKSTKFTAAEMTSLFATGYGIYKGYYDDLSDIQFGELFSAGIAASVRAFKTSGSGMAQSIQSLGASATTANVPLEEQLAILGMLQATMGGAEAGTKYKAFLRSAAKGGEALGLSFLDANNQLLSMPEILDRLRSKFGETMDAAEKMELQKAFGDTEAVALIDLLYSKTGDLQDNILNLYDAMGQGTSVAQEMASAMQETEPERFERLQQRIHNVTESIGSTLLPAVNDLMDRGEQLLGKMASWIEENQELVRTFMIIALAVGGFLAVAGTAITVVSGIGLVFTRTAAMGKIFVAAIRLIPSALETMQLYAMFAGDAVRAGFARIRTAGGVAVSAVRNVGSSLFSMAKGAAVSAVSAVRNITLSLAAMAKQAITAAASALAPLISSVWSFTAALLANPVTWVVIGIVALIAALVLLWNKCEWFRNGVMGILDGLQEKFDAAVSFITGAFGMIGSAVGSVLDAARSAVSEKLNNMKTAYEAHGGGICGIASAAVEGVKGYYTTGFTFLDNLTGGRLSEIRGKFASAMGGIVQGVGQKFSEAGSAFTAGLDRIKGIVSNAASWFFNSGGKIVSTFTSGIRSAFSGAVEAVRGGLQRIRNLLPFSDAREGPLSTLTLSGQRTMTTYAHGLTLAQDAPAEVMEQGLRQARNTLEREPVGKVGISAREENEDTDSAGHERTDSGKQVIIQKLIMQVDLKKIKDLQMLMNLLKEVEDYSNGNGDNDPDAAFGPV